MMNLRAAKNELQDPTEFDEFLDVVKNESITKYLEIGSRFGGSLWAMAGIMPKGSMLVSVDIVTNRDLNACVGALRDRHFIHQVTGDSLNKAIVERVRFYGPYDLLFIDGNHNDIHVRSDWKNYGPMARIVAFHDINRPNGFNRRKPWKMDVPVFWEQVRCDYRHVEIRTKIGIGVLWRG